MTSPKTVRILSLDGGGCRGYFSACFLERFLNQWGVPQDKIFEKFDVITGTSIGGIQALAYAKGVTPSLLKTFFTEKSPWIFTIRSAQDVVSGSNNASQPSNRPNTFQKAVMLTTSDPFYKAVNETSNYGDSRLKSELATVFGESSMNQLAVPTLVPAFEQTTQTPVLFSNVDLPGLRGQTEFVRNIALATGSAPAYFPPAVFGTGSYIDGGVFQNNPSVLGLQVGKMLYPSAKRYCVLSVGTGLGDVGFHTPAGQVQPSGGIVQLFQLIGLEIAAAQEANHKVLDFLSSLTEINIFYYRFQMPLDPNQDTELDNSTPALFAYLETAMNSLYNADAFAIGQFISRLSDG
jgi:predicted acylesterase/phospholipase RssA